MAREPRKRQAVRPLLRVLGEHGEAAVVPLAEELEGRRVLERKDVILLVEADAGGGAEAVKILGDGVEERGSRGGAEEEGLLEGLGELRLALGQRAGGASISWLTRCLQHGGFSPGSVSWILHFPEHFFGGKLSKAKRSVRRVSAIV